MRVAVALLVLAALAAPVRAAGDDEERARGHYEIGLGLYRLGDYRGALKEFGAGYELARKPGFLLNLGQTYRKLGELREARDMYRQFLSAVRGDDPARPQAQKVLAEIEGAIRKEPPAREPPRDVPREPAGEPTNATPAPEVTPEAPASPPASPPAPPPVQAEPAPVVHAAAPIHRSHRGLRIAGIAVGVVGLGLVGGGVGAAVAADGIARDLNAADAAGAAFDPSKDHAYSLDRGLSIGFFAGGAALAATGAVLLIVSAR
jgi:tetratricopeptide (TPR) repeat protein